LNLFDSSTICDELLVEAFTVHFKVAPPKVPDGSSYNGGSGEHHLEFTSKFARDTELTGQWDDRKSWTRAFAKHH